LEKPILTRPFDEHLDSDELDKLVSPAGMRASGSEELSEQALREAQRHVESCQACSRKVQLHKSVQREILRVRVPNPTPPTPDCIGDTEWLGVAAGLLSGAKIRELMKHAAQCGHCGPLLKNAAETLADETTPSEETLLSSLGSSRSEWQKNMAATLRDSVGTQGNDRGKKGGARWWQGLFSWPRPGFALAAIGVGVMAGWLGLIMLRPPSAEQLLAQAYTEHRALEVRIAGAKYAPVRVERSSAASNLDKSQSLLRAEALIGENLKEKPNDPIWLDARARADLLDGNYDSAIQSLKQALGLDPGSVPLLTDLGSAYFQRGEVTDRKTDYSSAIDWLSKALKESPDNPVALFNRAIVLERTFLYAQAVDDWKHYLRVEKDSSWASEGRSRLAALEETLRRHSRRTNKPLMTPATFADAMGSGGKELIDPIDADIEGYLKLALAEWLPSMSGKEPSNSSSNDSEIQSLDLLAEALREKHKDAWLSDLLNNLIAATPSHGLTLLVQAVQANLSGDYDNGLRLSEQSTKQFESEGNEAGRLRAEFEEVYSAHLSAHGRQCHERAIALLPRVRELHYSWLEVQTLLEAAACAAEISRIDESTAKAEEALQLARFYRYGNLELRATCFVAGLLEDPDQSLQYLERGLELYWQGNYESMRVYSLLAVMDTTAEHLRLWSFDEAVIKEALPKIKNDPNLALRGIEQYRLALAQLMIGDSDEANENFRAAQQLLEHGNSRDLIVSISIYLAESDVDHGHYLEALDLLNAVEPEMSRLSHDILRDRFYVARSAALRGSGQDKLAEDAIVPAVEIAERGLASISQQRQRFDWTAAFGPTYRALVQLRFRDSPESSFSWWEAFKGSSVRKGSGATHSAVSVLSEPTLPTFPSWQSDGTILVSYAVFGDGVAVWSFDGENVKASWLAIPRNELVHLVRRFAKNCEDPTSDLKIIGEQGHELYELLIKPIQAGIHNQSQLVFETDGELEMIPFEVLVDDNGKFLAESYEVTYSPGLLYFVDAHLPSHVDNRSRALVVGEPVSGDMRFSALPDALDESRDVAKLFQSVRRLSRNEATLSAVLRELPESQIVHFAGHTTFDRNVAGLVLSGSDANGDPGVLTASELSRKTLAQCRLVVLAACSSLYGADGGLGDRDSLARTLLSSGVPQVVASRWSVDSEATSEWMRAFYQNLLEGNSAAEATHVSMTYLRSLARWRHPFYWAAFGAFGLPGAPLHTSATIVWNRAMSSPGERFSGLHTVTHMRGL
jgi:CHAT domain-containing protein/tetratricopeptide (TPR) repeat protein